MLPQEWSINAYDTGHIRMDVHPQGYTKGTACEYLYQKLNIPKKIRMLLVMEKMILKCFIL